MIATNIPGIYIIYSTGSAIKGHEDWGCEESWCGSNHVKTLSPRTGSILLQRYPANYVRRGAQEIAAGGRLIVFVECCFVLLEDNCGNRGFK
ncbi:hypothetical protein AVEN_95701-1 [Araneus ventricosus]|uniref:Uncharacterized protein n=1 Tax=Araneus ventricosus TaxID=182803 RepID=A0A4Y2BB61_ARAVE|nr:hypothetical protein AVEN_95701-1 [Araneus ventricosus]